MDIQKYKYPNGTKEMQIIHDEKKGIIFDPPWDNEVVVVTYDSLFDKPNKCCTHTFTNLEDTFAHLKNFFEL